MSTAHVIVGLSGGVGSAVSAWRLKEQGYRVSGLFMVNWTEDEEGYCGAADDFQDARAVCEELDIPLHRVDFSREYRERVFTRFLADYAAGKTPNPDVLCNREVKFQPFREHALRLGADYIATGHYARIVHAAAGPQLLMAVDANKDQTYFLSAVAPAHLQKVMFPIGDLTKPEVRQLAGRAGLPVHRKKDSTGICFIGEREFRDFLGRYLQTNPGAIVDDKGQELGRHVGLMHYTLGQRRGIGLGGQRGAADAPWYVIAKLKDRNQLVVSQNPDHPQLLASELQTQDFNWLAPTPVIGAALQARIRHRQVLQGCTITGVSGSSVRVRFDQAQRAVAAGQYCVLYDGQRCLGGGEIVTVRTLADDLGVAR